MRQPSPSTIDSRSPQPIGFHVTMRLEDDRPIATTVEDQRRIARVVLSQGRGRGLLAFGCADNHLHVELATNRASVGHFARYVGAALKWRLGLGARFEPARCRPLSDQRHAYHTFHYVHRQDTRHDLHLDVAREGTSLPDLLGMRVVDSSLIARVRTCLPRVRREDLVAPFVAGTFDEVPLSNLDLAVLADSAAAALALPGLAGRAPDVVRARRAAIHAAGPEVPSRLLGECLQMGQRAVQSYRTHPREPQMIRAIELQARLRSGLRASASADRF